LTKPFIEPVCKRKSVKAIKLQIYPYKNTEIKLIFFQKFENIRKAKKGKSIATPKFCLHKKTKNAKTPARKR
jgi:hypothetical protein